MTVTGVTDYAILTIPRCRLGLRVSLTAPVPAPAPVCVPWASWTPPEACCCGAAEVVSDPFSRSFWGTGLRDLPLIGTRRGMAVTAVGAGPDHALANNSLTTAAHSDSRANASLARFVSYHLLSAHYSAFG